ncbi:MAG: hypothetical protein NC241_08930 [Bacteroides sp.]|nr:hypothetical protein [Bacteroides sp.]MCM1457624.1 hypothetical protein [Lachnoclostridium sp.]
MKNPAFIFFLVFMAFAATLFAQDRPSSGDRDKWLSEVRNYKQEYLSRELQLTKEQQSKFFPIYNEMDEELNKVASETRDLEAKVNDDKNATDTEVSAAARALFEQKSRESEIELRYFDRYKEILTPRQLIRLKAAERKFTQQLVRHHGRMKADARKRN